MSADAAKKPSLARLRRRLAEAQKRYSAERARLVGLSDRKSALAGARLEGRATGLGQAVAWLDEERSGE